MIVGLDATYSTGPHLSGVGAYSREILWGLARAHPESRFRWCYRPHRLLSSLADSLPSNASRRPLLSGRGLDLFHGLNQRIHAIRYPRTISTFHDLFVLTAEYSTSEFRARFAQQAREAAERSDRIICVSAYTASHVRELLGVEPGRIRVVPHGVHLRSEPPPESGAREKLVLCIGAIQKRKNLSRLVAAFESLPAGWRLILAGSSGFGSQEIFDRIAASPRSADIATPGYISESQKAALYRRASIFAFPSLDEGFGIPILEAMSWGVPVLTSNTSALPEVAGDAAVLVSPKDADAIADGLRRLALEEALRNELRLKGLERCREFTWEHAVKRTWQVYQEVL